MLTLKKMPSSSNPSPDRLEAWSINCPEYCFKDVLIELRNGLSPKPKEMPPGFPILRISAVRPRVIDLEDIRYLETDLLTAERYRLIPNDLLFTRYNGTLEFVGACAMYRGSYERLVVYPDKLIRARVDQSRVMPAYTEIWFTAPARRNEIETFVKTSAGQKGISGSDIKSLVIKVPSLEEQTRNRSPR
jgi:type I restriction enzyme, S subunit